MKTYFFTLKYFIILFLGFSWHTVFGQCTTGQPNISVEAEAFSTMTIVEGTSTTLTSPVSGTTYQWTLDGVPISGASSSSITVSNFSSSDVGDYNVIVDSVPLLNSVTLGIFASSISDYDSDRQALIDFYNATNGPSWTDHTNWLIGPMETWHGVKVENCRVTELRVSDNNINGTLPASFQNLTELKRLSIRNNTISGVLDITRMTSLIDLVASGNNLEDIVFGNNDLLQRVHIQDNDFTPGKIIDLTGMSQLIDFRAARLQLGGITVDGDYNNLLYFIIADNQISGKLDISGMPNLRTCNARDNQFTDFDLGTGSELQRFYLYNNPLDPGLTMDISGMRKLIDFRVQRLKLGGLVVSGEYEDLLYFIVAENQISGMLDISEMPNLKLCNARDNRFTDFNLGTGAELQRFYLYNNPLDPGLTMDISGMRKLVDFRVQGLNLGDLIVRGEYNDLRYFIIAENEISGALDLSNMPNIISCNARDNFFDELILHSNVSVPDRTLNNLNVINNNLHFDDLATYNSLFDTFNFYYTPQRDVPTDLTGDGRVSVNVGGTGNVYDWSPSGPDAASFLPTVDGVYSCEVTNTTGGPAGIGVPRLTIRSIPRSVIIGSSRSANNSTSVDKEVDLDEKFSLYPNPVEKSAPIFTNMVLKGESTVRFTLHTINGQKIEEYTYEGKRGSNTFQLNTEDLSAGQYMLTLESGTDKTSKLFVVK